MDRSLDVDEIFDFKYLNSRVPFAYLKHIWDTGRRQEAFDGLKKYIQVLTTYTVVIEATSLTDSLFSGVGVIFHCSLSFSFILFRIR